MEIKETKMDISPTMAASAAELNRRILLWINSNGRDIEEEMGIIVLTLANLLFTMQKFNNIEPLSQMDLWAESVKSLIRANQDSPEMLSYLYGE